METKQCEANIHKDWHNYQCSRKASIEVEGKYYCGIHNPIKIKEKDKERSQKFIEEMEELEYRRLAVDYCKSLGLSLEQLKGGLNSSQP